jgi:hypothetical protein
MLRLALAEERMRAARTAVGDQRDAEASAAQPEPHADKTPVDVTRQMEEAARLHLAAARGEQLDADAVDTLTVEASETELRARLVTLATSARTLMTKADGVGMDKGDHPSGAWSVHHVCELILTKVNGSTAAPDPNMPDKAVGGWHGQLNLSTKPAGKAKDQLAQRRAAIKAVTTEMSTFAQALDVNGFFKDAEEQVKREELKKLIRHIALQVGIAVVTGQAIGAVGAAIRGVSLAGQIGAEIRNASLLYKGATIAAEATANTAVAGAMGGKFGARELAENALGIVLSTAVLKPFHGLLDDGAAVEKQIRTWGQLAKRGGKAAAELVIDTGGGIGAAGVAHAVTHGGEMNANDAAEWVTQGLSIAASKFVQMRTIDMHHRLTAAVIEFKSRPLEKLQVEAAALRDLASSKQDPKHPPTPEEAVAMLKERRRLLLAEHELLVHDPKAKQALAKNDADLSATGEQFADVPLQLSRLTARIEGHLYEGTPEHIQEAFNAASAMGVPLRPTWVPEHKMWRVTAGKRTIEIYPIKGGKRQGHESLNAADAVPHSSFTGITPHGETRSPFAMTDVHASAKQATDVLNRGTKNSFKAQADGTVVIAVAGGTPVTVRFAIGTPTSSVAHHSYVPGATDVTVTVSSQARPQDLARAAAHELAEVHALMSKPGMQRAGKLHPGSTATDLGAHDVGRKAEIEVLVDELTTQPARRADVMHELKRVIEHLGFDINNLSANQRARKLLGPYVVDAIAIHTGALGSIQPKIAHWPKDGQMALARIASNPSPDAVRLLKKISDNIDLPGVDRWAKLASRQLDSSKAADQILDLEFSLDTAIGLRKSDASTAVEVHYYDGKRVTNEELAKLQSAPGYDRNKHRNIDIETSSERREMKRPNRDVTDQKSFFEMVTEGVRKYREAGVRSKSAGGTKMNIIEVDYGSRIKTGWSEADIRAEIATHISVKPDIKNVVDRISVHAVIGRRSITIGVDL